MSFFNKKSMKNELSEVVVAWGKEVKKIDSELAHLIGPSSIEGDKELEKLKRRRECIFTLNAQFHELITEKTNKVIGHP